MTWRLARCAISLAAGTLAATCVVATAASAATDAEVLAALARGADWLATYQNDDGSWGDAPAEQMLNTTEAVRAFRAMNMFGPEYQSAVVWLQNHRATNSDFAARRFAALQPHGVLLVGESSELVASKSTAAPGIPLAGWGVAAGYRADALDTALVALALGYNNPTFYVAHVNAFDALASLLRASTWTIGQTDAVLPFSGDVPTTVAGASAIRACAAAGIPHCASLLAILPPVDSALANHAPATVLERALITEYFAAQRDATSPPIPVAQIGARIDTLLAQQTSGPQGNWDGDVPSTTAALRALARWIRLERSDATTIIPIADAGLRRAVNRALGHRDMDGVTRGELWRLTTLDLSYSSLPADLSVLTEARNLTAIDVSGNYCLQRIPNINALLAQWFPGATITNRLVGDLNLDGAANVYDLYLLQRKLQELSVGLWEPAADLNNDGEVDVRDLYWLDRLLLNHDVAALCTEPQ